MDLDFGIPYYERLRNTITSVRQHYYHSAHIDRLALIGVFAALSPNNDEMGNFRDLTTMCDAHKDGLSYDSISITSYPKNKEKARRILNGEYPLDVLRGPKTRAFFHNILDPNGRQHVTVDGHMFSIWHGKRYKMKEAIMSEKLYHQISSDYKQAAKKVHLVPCQLQSVLWLAWKRIHKIRFNPQFKFTFEEYEHQNRHALPGS